MSRRDSAERAMNMAKAVLNSECEDRTGWIVIMAFPAEDDENRTGAFVTSNMPNDIAKKVMAELSVRSLKPEDSDDDPDEEKNEG